MDTRHASPGAAPSVTFWDRLNPFDELGMPGGMPAGARTSTVPGIGRSSMNNGKDWDDRLYHPDNPMFWVGALLAVTFGLVATSTSLRVGPFKASASAGKSS